MPLLQGSGRVEVIATGLVEFDRRGRPKKDNRLRHDGFVFQPGQRVHVTERDARKFTRAQQGQVVADLPAVDWWGAPGRILQTEPGEAHSFMSTSTYDALRIVQGTGYDPGNAAFRFHTALNEHTPHASAFVRYINRHNNPFSCPWQYDANTDPATVRALLLDADVVHCHMDQRLTQNVGMPRRPRVGQTIVRHYHGTQFNGAGQQIRDEDQTPMLCATQDDMDGYLLVGARLTVCALRPGRIHWLPITIPVARYAAMVTKAPRVSGEPLRIAHSPTRTKIKGTRDFLRVCRRLTKRGVPVEPVLIEKTTHADALRLRASADATFDSFALGIQGSGLEGAAMGQPVIAGDAKVADLYREEVGEVPYTFAGDETQLEAAIERLALDADHFTTEARRANLYVRVFHDYPRVAARYCALLADAGARRVG
jgi:hypothetical protein